MKDLQEENGIITKIAKNIFGNDLVKNGYIFGYSKENLKETKDFFNDLNIESKCLEFDYNTIVIKFINGNNVSFTGSEWASMKLLDSLNC